MKANKILILGFFGMESNHLDGQTIKTRSIFDLINLKKKKDLILRRFDTESFRSSKFSIFRLLREVFYADLVIYIPGRNNLRLFFIPLFLIVKIFNKKLHLVAVGGWLSEYLKDKRLYRYCLSKIHGIYPQTSVLTRNLKVNHSLNNVYQLSNFRLHKFFPENREITTISSLVFLARIHPLKGLDTIFELAKRIKSFDVQIDIYGPFHEPYREEFLNRVRDTRNIKYCGILQPHEIYATLNKYDLLLFPTEYFTEGFPGTILDSFISEVPVVASEWQYAHEFIDEGLNGVIVPFLDQKAFINKVLELVQNPMLVNKMKQNMSIKKDEFSAEKAWEVINEHIMKGT